MHKIVKYLLASIISFPVLHTHSATLEIKDGILFGANDINVNGILYDVRFVDSSCAELFNGCDESSDLPFPESYGHGRLAFSTALIDEVLIDSPLGNFDSIPSLTNGCSHTELCYILTPRFIDTRFEFVGVGIGYAENTAGDNIDSVFPGGLTIVPGSGSFIHDTRTEDPGFSKVWAVWEQKTPTPVPLPPAALLFISALIGMGVFTNKSKQHR